ncbi:putative RNA-directed DNA polymerase from transposon BS [Trichonephila clavipes]|nr:putative RNA-directed DNA polymerase from transposon BS [Trichonephila clavipes]
MFGDLGTSSCFILVTLPPLLKIPNEDKLSITIWFSKQVSQLEYSVHVHLRKNLCTSQTIKLAESLCEKLDYRTLNTKLWKLAEQIDNLKPSNEETNAIISDNGHVSVDARNAAEALAQHYANESRLDFSSYDKHFARVIRNQLKSCRDRPEDNPLFNVDFTLPELSYALQSLDTIKSPGPDSIPGHFLSHLGILGRERLLYIGNLSWKNGKLPRQWKSAIVILIHKPNKNAGLTTSYRPFSLTYITCKLME